VGVTAVGGNCLVLNVLSTEEKACTGEGGGGGHLAALRVVVLCHLDLPLPAKLLCPAPRPA